MLLEKTLEGDDIDRRVWMQTDQQGERIAIVSPLSGVRVMSATGSARRWSELHDSYALCLIHPRQPGVFVEWMCGRSPTISTGAGEVMIMELGELHRTTRVSKKADFSVIQIEPSILCRVAEELGAREVRGFKASTAADPLFAESIARFVHSVASSDDDLALECDLADVVARFLGICGEHRLSAPAFHRGIKLARDTIWERFSSAHPGTRVPTLDDLSRLGGLSAPRFSHAFKEWVGISPHAFLNVCRLTAGARMLERGASPTEAAGALGFSDLPHFNRLFRRQYGVPPGSWIAVARTAARGSKNVQGLGSSSR